MLTAVLPQAGEQVVVSGANRFEGLDGLRAFAVSFVILHHVLPFQVPGGFIGVDIFFALSGFLITSLLVREHQRTGRIALGAFYFRRLARLTPALVLVVLGTLAIQLFVLPDLAPISTTLAAAAYLMNWWRALGLGDSPIIGHTWSLACEEQFYLLWPPILLCVLAWRPRLAPVAALALAAASTAWTLALTANGAPPVRTYNGFDTRSAEILIGCAFAFLPREGATGGLLTRLWFVPTAALLACLALDEKSILLPLGGYAALAVLSSWLVIAVISDGKLARPLSWAPLVYAGRISYGLYLWHYPILALARYSGLHGPVQYASVLAGTGVAAVLSFHFFETPILSGARALLQNGRLRRGNQGRLAAAG